MSRPIIPSRRGLLAGSATALLAGATVVATGPAAACRPDDELLRLGDLLHAAVARENAAWADADALHADDDDEAAVRAKALTARSCSIVDRIEQERATTLAGLLVKIQAVDWCGCGDTDLLEMFDAGQHPSTDVRLVVGLWCDLRAMGSSV